MSKVIDVNQDNFQTEVLNSNSPVLVDFWAPWCLPCKMMAPILDELSVNLSDKVKVVKVNTEDSSGQSLALEYQIQSVPSLKLFKDGRVIGEFFGLRSSDSLSREIEEYLNKAA